MSTLTNFRLPLFCFFAATLGLFFGTAARADLWVIPSDNGSTTPGIFRFEDRTGAFLDQFGPDSEGYEGMAKGPDDKIYLAGNTLGYGDVSRFNLNGQYLGHFTGASLRTPGALTFEADGDCYVLCSNWPQTPSLQQIWRYHGTTGAFKDVFITDAGDARALRFGRDGHLYVADSARGIVRYNGSSGAFLDTFVPLGRGGLRDVHTFVFGPDGNVYAGTWISNAVVRFNGNTGAFLDYVVAPGSGGLNQPGGLAFGPDGSLYVSSTATHNILRFDGRTGAFRGVFAAHSELISPTALVFTPPAPRLLIQHVGLKVEISWPNSGSPQNWSLVTQAKSATTTGWVAVTNSLAIVGTNCVVTDRCDGRSVFYRLDQR